VSLAALGGFWLWAILAIRFSNLPSEDLRIGLAAVFALAPLIALAALPRRRRTLALLGAACAAVAIWFAAIPASNDRDWIPENSREVSAEFAGDRVTIRNLRNFVYRSETDFDARYVERSYDLSRLKSVDFVKSHWDGLVDVAHTMFSFGFEDGEYLAISVETRRERGEPQGALRGLFKQYELIYIVADERDLIRLRTNYRGEDVYLYPTQTSPDEARTLLVSILERANQLAVEPEFYNSLLDNCTTGLLPHFWKIRPNRRFDIRLLMNGHTDELALEGGWIASELSIEELREFHHVNQYVSGVDDPSDFSFRIRPHLRAGPDAFRLDSRE
jgi:hypothetical protein